MSTRRRTIAGRIASLEKDVGTIAVFVYDIIHKDGVFRHRTMAEQLLGTAPKPVVDGKVRRAGKKHGGKAKREKHE